MTTRDFNSHLRNRRDAGLRLAQALSHLRGRTDLLVLALPRGGVPVAYEIAHALQAPLDLLVVRKLGAPAQPELAIGAIASGGVRVLNPDLLRYEGVSDEELERIAQREGRELLRREGLYRGERPRPTIRGRQVLLVDDGLATGATMRAAVEAVRREAPARILVAAPVGSAEAVADLEALADEVVCPLVPGMLSSIGRWYLDFAQTEDDEVRELLRTAWEEEARRNPGVQR
ncbi:phosphoribosyltransferase [Pseudomonas sp. QL9]|uniref:phosphoribosyltransferase n=1 Tax=Pseudomonas sp. QL9 TaxID=3242725 RepID=UPI00352A11D3